MKFRPVALLLSVWWSFPGVHAQAAPQTFQDLGVSFTYDDATMPKPKAHRVKAFPLPSPTDTPDGVAPAHVEIQFGKDQGKLWIFPTSDPRVKDFRQSYPTHATAKKELRRVLRERPTECREMPMLPWADISLPFYAKIHYLDFHGGSGVAWLTQWTIEPTPIASSNLLYLFQGLTRDGAWYVAAEIHVSHRSVPATPQVIKDYRAFEKAYPHYLMKSVKELAAQPDESFRPSLAALHALFGSMAVKATP